MLHYMLDAYGTDEENSNNLMCVNELLVKVMQDLSLSPVMPPFLLPYYYCEDAYDGGISAFCFCRGGHVTIHTFPYKGCYFADVFCDEFFTSQEAEKAFTNRLYGRKVQSVLVDRRFPDSFPTKEDADAADFGPHYLINVKDVEMTMEKINVLLDSLPEKIDMLPITRPYVLFDRNKDPRYISGIILVAQSHISVHYDIKTKQAYMDIFSCKFLDDKKIRSVIEDLFGENAEYYLVIRGAKYEWNSKTSREQYDRSSAWRNNSIK